MPERRRLGGRRGGCEVVHLGCEACKATRTGEECAVGCKRVYGCKGVYGMRLGEERAVGEEGVGRVELVALLVRGCNGMERGGAIG